MPFRFSPSCLCSASPSVLLTSQAAFPLPMANGPPELQVYLLPQQICLPLIGPDRVMCLLPQSLCQEGPSTLIGQAGAQAMTLPMAAGRLVSAERNCLLGLHPGWNCSLSSPGSPGGLAHPFPPRPHLVFFPQSTGVQGGN